MKVTQSNHATEEEVAYIKEDLVEMFSTFSQGLEEAQQRAENNIEIHNKSINLDFDGIKRHENETHDKKWRGRKIAISVAGIAGFVGLIAAGAISGNPTFFSAGNLITGGLLALGGIGLGNYLAAMSPKHIKKLQEIEQERAKHLANVPFSEQALHDQKEIETYRKWQDAIAEEMGFSKIPTKYMHAYISKKLEEEKII